MKREDAEEFTKSLGQIFEGSWRQVALGIRLGVPGLLGYHGSDAGKRWVREQVSEHARISRHDRQAAVLELAHEGMKQRDIAAALGISQSAVSLDQNKSNRARNHKGSSSRIADLDQNKSRRRKATIAPNAPVGVPDSFDPIQVPCSDCETQEQNWQHSLSSLAGDVISARAYWSRQFPGWETFKAPSELVTLAKQAAKAWSELASAIEQQQDNCNGRSTEEAQA